MSNVTFPDLPRSISARNIRDNILGDPTGVEALTGVSGATNPTRANPRDPNLPEGDPSLLLPVGAESR